jgi:hypothetical protein
MMRLETMEEEPEAWVTSKITLAVDYIATARDYLEFHHLGEPEEMEEPEDDEGEEDEAEFAGVDVYECIRDMTKEELGEAYEELQGLVEEVEGLKKKAEKSGISYSILKQVYDRGMAAWKGGHRPGTTPQQWAFARVNSFITKGKGTWGGADSDLAAKVSKNEEFSNFIEALEWGTDELRKKYAGDTPGQPTDIQVADHCKELNNINVERIKANFSEDIVVEIDRCISEGVDLFDNNYRLGSEKFYEFFRAVRESKVELTGMNKRLIEETDIGEIAEYEGQHVPLDCPMIAEEDEKDPPLNQPKRGGPKKFYVFVKDPSTGNIKKVTWGDTTGLSVKLNDPEARKSFAARHQCSTQKDRTSAAYWACNTPRYAKQLGLSGGGNFYW